MALTIEELVQRTYDDTEMADAILADIERLDTADDILKGERLLPHPIDARKWHDHKVGRTPEAKENIALLERIKQLEQSHKDLAKQLLSPNVTRIRELEAEVARLKQGESK